jgi:PAS domain S-box-containing protein
MNRADNSTELDPETVRGLGVEVWQHSPDGLLIVDEQGRIAAANPSLCRLLGYAEGSLEGSGVEQLVPLAVRSDHVELRAAYNEHPVGRPMGVGKRLEAVMADGTPVPVHVSLAPCRVGAEAMTLAVVRDVTDWVLTEERLGSLNLKRLVAEDRERIARDLHDNVIQGLFALGLTIQAAIGLRGGDLDDRLGVAVETVDDIISSIRRVVFGVTRPAGQRSIRSDLLQLITERAAAAGFAPEVSFHGPLEDLPPPLAGDLMAVVGEALTNAIRHADATTISVDVSVDRSQLTAKVADDGVGIASKRRSGLANMAERATSHEGRLEIDTRPGEGTTLHWTIPLAVSGDG